MPEPRDAATGTPAGAHAGSTAAPEVHRVVLHGRTGEAGTVRTESTHLDARSPGPEPVSFDAPAGRTVLASALRAGVMLASSCRNGTCRACMLRLEQGRVRYQIEWPGLLAEEKAEGWILPCVACPESDLVLAAGTADRA